MSLTLCSSSYSSKIRRNVEQEQNEVPDSTTSLSIETSEFNLGQDVLMKHKDGRYYLGTIVEVNAIREQCLVKFGDNTDNWSSFKDLTKLNSGQEDLLCVVCKKYSPNNRKEILSCDRCGRSYHKKCHHPEIPDICQKEGASWMCTRCLATEPKCIRKSAERFSRRDLSKSRDFSIVPSTVVKSFQYDPNVLHWDTYHRVNEELIYCYCGNSGEWYRQMLQCGRCRQWFHENCIGVLQYPLYCGDRFYVFVCSVCNYGKEFLRRLEMNWDDLVHLILFNLTVFHSKKYYDLDSVILPYMNDNWNHLQLPFKLSSVSKNERRFHTLSVLTNNRNRFKCGREMKKRTTIWGLRVRLPPPVPCLSLPPTGQIVEQELRDMWQGNRRCQMLPGHDPDFKITKDPKIRTLMSGAAYKNDAGLSESDSPCPSPDNSIEEHPELEIDYKFGNYSGPGCAKKTAPVQKLNLQRKKRLLALNARDKILRKRKSFNDKDERKSMKSNRSYLTRLSLDGKTGNAGKTELLAPNMSVSAPPTPPASGSASHVSDLSMDYLDATIKDTKPDKPCPDFGSLTELTHCDTSGDETSSKSTLDLIIPPPKDFKGENNPFLALLRGNHPTDTKNKNSKDITLPLPLTAVIPGKPRMRPLKRQLSEKDIVIGPNGEVKRRRLRRGRLSHGNLYGGTASKTAAVIPAKPAESKDWNGAADYAFGGRRLRQRPEKPQDREETVQKPPTPKPSPVKQEPNINMDDLKSSVNIYFGAATRIASGERFQIKAKRFSSIGKIEYLIEWEGPSNGMT